VKIDGTFVGDVLPSSFQKVPSALAPDFGLRPYTLSELDAAGKGTFVIKERVRAISGNITIISFPERGTWIEIAFPTERK
jgi:sensor histidine kinase regulating citrate/malate metabolism